TDTLGLWVSRLLPNALENGTLTLLLVRGFSGALNQDLDVNNDGILDQTPWAAVVDAVAVNDGGIGDLTYGLTLGPNFDGLSSFAPGGASRIPDGLDSDSPSDWVRNDFDLAGIPGYIGTPIEGEALNTPGAPNQLYVPSPSGGVCGDPVVYIHQIQGSGTVFDPAFGGVQSVEAVVTAIAPGLGGLYIQEEPVDADADPTTSEGLFVYLGGTPEAGLAVGDLVRVTGTVTEYVTSSGASSQTELAGSPIVTVCDPGAAIPPAAVVFPLLDPAELEAVEGMLVSLPQELVISEYFNFDRFGEVVVSLPPEGWDRLYTPTAVVEPGQDAIDLSADYATRRITIDDARSAQNPDPAIHPGNGLDFTLDNRFRGGDTIAGIAGVIDDSFGLYRLQPTTYGTYGVVNPRPESPDPVGGNVRVATMNVLNYFLTLDDSGAICGPDQNLECRGADDAEELERQRAKLLDALARIDGDVVGLVEMENTPGVEPAADLVDRLNDLLGAGAYAFIDTGIIGTDAIRVGLIYKPALVRPIGDFAILDSSVDPDFLDDKNRPVLAQTFEDLASGERFTVAVNHLKSKGSPCDDVGDPDVGDGQGNCNLTRTAAAEALVDWLDSNPTGSGDGRYLIIGDLNSYDKEDPIDTLLAGGYTDLVGAFGWELAYSYVFDGQFGYLDYAMASSDLVSAVTGTTVWHINADEPDLLDYDTTFKQPAQDALYEPNAFRSSDHDPVIVGLDLEPPKLRLRVEPQVLWPANHKYVRVVAKVVATDNESSPEVRLVSVTSNEPDDGVADGSTKNDIVILDDRTFLLRAE
ncbi:MAG TPA: ExeM/NucH family extracellular endonuclease, partial [Dermatophilaceae bacterium]|nr:ExeM/NucH family extracellular endonuclease [Dermatophilaceae bacterium]